MTVHGTTVRYEPQPNKNTVGYWTNKDDWVSWDFQLDRPGKFEVVILQGCGKGSGGSEVEFSLGDKPDLKLKTVVEDTGGFQNFVPRTIGTVELSAGPHTLSVRELRSKLSEPGARGTLLDELPLAQVKLLFPLLQKAADDAEAKERLAWQKAKEVGFSADRLHGLEQKNYEEMVAELNRP